MPLEGTDVSTNVQNEAVEEYETGHINEESGTEELNNFMQLANIEASSSEGQYAQTEPSSDEKLAELQYAIARQPLLREILYKTLQFCRVEANLETLEKEVASFPEYATCRYSAVALANILVKHYGLKLVEHSSDGSVVQEADKKGLSEDEVDDLVAFVSYVTTPEGEVLVEQHEPAFRLAQLLEVDSSYDAVYQELLEYLYEQPRSYNDVKNHFKNEPLSSHIVGGNLQSMQPSVFVDRLERAGAIVWNGGWTLSDAGMEYVEKFTVHKAVNRSFDERTRHAH